MLARQNISCIIAVPRIENGDNPQNRSFQVCTYDDCTNKTLTFPNGKGPDIVHAWTPREHVRKFCQNLENKYNFKTIIHLEDNEEYLTESALRKPCEELKTLTLEELDSIIPQNRFHPVRGWEWLKKAHGLTMIIATLHRFNPSGLPSTILQAPVDDRFFYPRPINHGLRERLNIPENHIVLCYTGDIRAPKKQEVLELYRAIELLNQQGFPTTLIRTGTNFLPLDPDESRYKDFEKNLGWVSRHEVADIMAAADILIQPGWPGPFDDERLPAKLPEYFAMGRPIILPRTNLGLKV
jgi:glycosyltransferase involved in cell wall biosynthesis